MAPTNGLPVVKESVYPITQLLVAVLIHLRRATGGEREQTEGGEGERATSGERECTVPKR